MKKLLKYGLIAFFVIVLAFFVWFKYINDSPFDTSRPESSSTAIKDLSAVILPVCTESLATPKTDVTYYVAANEPGADNELCDGLVPTNEGGNHCPFKDFTSARVREKLFFPADGGYGTKSVTVKIRQGTYFIHPLRLFPNEPLQPLLINANGQSDRESVVLMNFNGEQAILDGSCPANLRTCDYPDAPGKIWTILEIYGSNIIVQGLTFDNAYGRNIQIGSTDTHIRCNKLIGSYSSDSDSIKATSDEGPVYIYGNEFSGPNEQAIDGTRAQDWIIENNTVRDGGGFGFKFGARNILIRNNRFLGLKVEKAIISLGGDGSTDHSNEYEAYNIRAEDNTFEDVHSAAGFAHCYNCTFSNNSITRAKIGVDFGEEHPSYIDGCRNGKGCLPTANAKIFNNRFRGIQYPETNLDNIFIAADSARVLNLEAGNNLYCVPEGEQPIFWRGGVIPQDLIRNLAVWQEKSQTDRSSQIAAAIDLKCTNW